MGFYLCKYCEVLTNLPPKGLCQDSPSGNHKWIYGSSVESYVEKLWNDPANRLGTAESKSRALAGR